MTRLQHLDDFTEILANYQVSDEAVRLLSETPLALLAGITSAGRNTIIAKLLQTGQYYYVISDTTRPPRANNGIMEQDGREYWFRSEEEVLADLRAGQYLEAAIIHRQQVSGISLRELRVAQQQHKIAINEIEVVGVANLVAVAPASIKPIFVVPPSFDIWMERWIKRGRQTAQDTQHRIASAQKELQMALDVDYYNFIVNDNLDAAVSRVQECIAGVVDPIHQAHGRAVAESILSAIQQTLRQMS